MATIRGEERLTETGSTLGTVGYLSPEQVQSQPITNASDIYSLGVVAFELLTGQHPFPDESPTDLLIKQLNEPLPDLHDIQPDLPQELNDVLQQATAKDPALRYLDAVTFSAAFQAAAAGERIEPAAAVSLTETTDDAEN